MYMYQRKSFYQIFCSNAGARMLCETVFQTIKFQDSYMANYVSVEQLIYCTVLALWARAAYVARVKGYLAGGIREVSRLIDVVKGLLLPDVLAEYVETIGTLTLASGAVVAPWFSARKDMENQQLGTIKLDDLLGAAGRDIPDNYWSIDSKWIYEWSQATGRLSRYMKFRSVNWEDTEGCIEMVVTSDLPMEHGAADHTYPVAPQQLTDEEGKLGAVYQWRSYSQLEHWPAETAQICAKLFFGSQLELRAYCRCRTTQNYLTVEQPTWRPPQSGNAPKPGQLTRKRPYEPVPKNRGSQKQSYPNRCKGPQKMSVGYDKAFSVGARLMYQRKRFYQIFCSNAGARMLCETVFQTIKCRDYRTANYISVEQLIYCTVITLWARGASVAIAKGYLCEVIPEMYELCQAVKGLRLPNVLAQYVETIGTLTLASGAMVAPWFSTREAMGNQQLGTINPDDLLRAAGRRIADNYWSIDREWICELSYATLRLYKEFRCINWEDTEGCTEMVVTTDLPMEHGAADHTYPVAPQQLTDEEGQLGAVYQWRSYSQLEHWPAETAQICTKLFFGSELDLRVHRSGVVARSFI